MENEKHLSPEEVQKEIHSATWNAIAGLLAQLDKQLSRLNLDYVNTRSPTESQVIAYYAVLSSMQKFKGELHKQLHAEEARYHKVKEQMRNGGVE